MAASRIVAEYAKSNRSTCKECSKNIDGGALRLGLVSKDPRGYEIKKWHHLSCFPTDSQQLFSAEKIQGFSTLKISDQESLKKLEVGRHKQDSEGCKGNKRTHKESDVAEIAELDEKNSKKLKLSTSSNEAVQETAFSISDVKTKYKDATLLPKWKAFQTIIFLERDDGLHDSSKIAAFDFDGCLANTSVKRTGPDEWKLMYPSIPEKLQNLYKDDYKLVIFTNESNIERWKNKRQVAVDSKLGRLHNFIELVKVPIQVFVACGLGKTTGQTEDPFRKPKTGMWRIMEQHFNSGIPIDMDKSFYVGDAAGRKNDHSDADTKFAQALGLKFYVPEDYFGA
ncbi:polynucleotide 3'-phosphatase ZDP isoform X2 [Macadamia integrifolia]|uniref:polynucleotide 3'-phosphatase ZDP isoform X2 n=1 Tax=Macadamia integrifolia TaxID=60698 RepID=UPI001C532BA9|nr:polynucleotide 3'-phosphatase ZDP isoform X2 [Macadamia integrifolia]